MPYNYEDRKKKQITAMKSVMDYGMGILFLLLGLFFLFHDQLKIDVARLSASPLLDKFFGGLCALYGIWRIYRGYKKNYFR